MKTRSLLGLRHASRLQLSLATLFITVGLPVLSQAANQTWRAAPADATWVGTSNWGTTGTVTAPGALTGTTNDVATFNTALSGGTIGGSSAPITIDATRRIGGITFDTASVGAYVIGSDTTSLTLSNIGAGYGTHAITLTASAASSQTIAAPMGFVAPSSTNGQFGYVNNATSSAVTLTLSGATTLATSRPCVMVLDGANTGANTFSGVISQTGTNQGVPMMIKRGAGTWVLTAANVFGGTAITGTSGNSGIQILDGLLKVQNNAAFGTSGTANANQVYVGNKSLTYGYNGALTQTYTSVVGGGGTLELAGGITIDNGVALNLYPAGTIRSNGSNATNGGIVVPSTISALSATLSTVGSSDVFTIGNAANDVTGGATDSVLNVSGPGTVALTQASNYAGGWSVNNGVLQLGNATALGAAATTSVTFGASSTGTLRLNTFSPTITSLSTNATPGTPIVENGTSSTSTLTVNQSTATTFAGVLRDGTGGVLALTKSGAGSLTLTGTNTYTGDTLVSAGTLKINGSSTTANTSVSSGGTLAGAGSLTGTVNLAANAHLAPGNTGVGTLTVGGLTVNTSAILDYEFDATAAPDDQTVVTATDGLNLYGGGINLYQEGTTTQFNTVGTYNLFQFSGTLGGSASSLSVLNPDATKNYAFTADSSHVILTISNSVISNWASASGGDWATGGNWTGAGVPNGSGNTAIFGSSLTAPGTVTLNGDKTVATIAFNNSNAYTLAPASTETLYLDNSLNSAQAQIIGTNGSHTISAPVSLTSNTTASVVNSGDTLTLSGIVSGSGSLSKGGAGTLALTAANTYLGETALSAGRIDFAAGGLSTGALTIGGGTLRWLPGNTEDITIGARPVTIAAGDTTFDTNGNNVVLADVIGNSGTGGIIKTGSGSLTLAAGNSFAGTTTISAGSLIVGSDSAFGFTPGSATPGSVAIGAATLASNATFTITLNRGVALNSASSNVDVASGTTLTCNSIVAGTGKLNLSNTGTLNLAVTNSYSGGTVIPTGSTLNLSGTGTAGTGQVALQGGTLKLNRNTFNVGNIFVDAGQTGTIDGVNDRVGLGGLSGSGTLTLISRFGGSNVGSGAFGFRLVGGNGPFTGTLNLKSGTGAVSSFAAYFNGGTFEGNLSGATVNMSDNARIGGVNNSGGNTMTIGALIGDSTAILGGADYAGTQTYSIGGKNLDTTFAGVIANGSAGNANLIKTGTGTLTLSGTNTYFGTTAVNGGTLAIANASALGSDTVATSVAGGDVSSRVAISGGLTISEPWTLGGRTGVYVDSAAIINLSGDNVLTGLVSPATGGDHYNVQSDAGSLVISGGFLPAGAITGVRYLQLVGNSSLEWSGAIQNGTAVVTVNLLGTGTKVLSGVNTYTGDTVVNVGTTLTLAPTGQIKLAPTTNGISNKITGTGTATLNGALNIDLTGANLTTGNSWLLVDVANLTESYGANFSVTGFTQSGTNWTKVSGANTWTFSQTTGTLSLSVVSDPFIPWIATYFPGETNAAIVGKAADPDNDGRNNLAEFAFNGNPNSGVNDGKSVGKVATVGGGNVLTLTIPVRTGATFSDDGTTHEEVSALVDGVIYHIQGSDDLAVWNLDVTEVPSGDDRDAIQFGLPALDTGWTYRTFRSPGVLTGDSADFLRVKVTE